MRLGWMSILTMGLLLTATAYVAVGLYQKHGNEASFASIRVGASEESVISIFGNPSKRERAEEPFARYASAKCEFPCAERLWFENRMFLDVEAWSVSIDNTGHVIRKDHWVSP
jgi:hypothetical protein